MFDYSIASSSLLLLYFAIIIFSSCAYRCAHGLVLFVIVKLSSHAHCHKMSVAQISLLVCKSFYFLFIDRVHIGKKKVNSEPRRRSNVTCRLQLFKLMTFLTCLTCYLSI